MPKAYIQLGASGSSPSICPARATGCSCNKPKCASEMRRNKKGIHNYPKCGFALIEAFENPH